MPSYLHQIVPEIARKHPSSVAIIGSSRVITYRELDREINSIAASLINNGLKHGERMGMISRNSIEFVAVFFAISRAGGVPVPLNYSLKPLGIAEQANDCSISALYFGKGMEMTAKEVGRKVRTVRFMVSDADLKNRSLRPRSLPRTLVVRGGLAMTKETGFQQSRSKLATVIYTSGTTASPLGVMLSHRNLISNSGSIVKYLRIMPSDKACCVLPLNYIYGLSILLSHLMAGATVILDNRSIYPNLILDTIDKFKATTFAGVSSHYALLLDSSDIACRELSSLKRFLQAGDRMPEMITEKLLGLFPRKKLYLMYGLTEASPRLTYLDPKLALKKPGSVGRAIPGVKVKVMNKAGKECGPREEGEIIAKGDNIMLGYWNNRNKTRIVIKKGWLYTGDIGYKDKDGDLIITGRNRDFVKMGGNRVNLREVEDVVRRYKGIIETVAVDVNDSVLGKRIKLFAVPSRGIKISENDIMKFCKTHLSSYEVPAKIVIMKAIPKDSFGKVDKKSLV